MSNRIYLEANPYQVRVALTEDDSLAELYIERKGGERLVGNVYKGKVKNVLPGMQAAFVDIGLERNAFLYAGDINFDEADFHFRGKNEKKEHACPDIRQLVRVGQEIMVQVIKEPFGTKGARITTNITLPGRSLVLMPTADYVGVSRRIEDEEKRMEMRALLEEIRPPHIGLIARTVSFGMTREELEAQIQEQMKLYRQIMLHYEDVKAPSLVHSEESLVYRTARDMLREDIEKFYINDPEVYQRVRRTVQALSPQLLDRVKLFHKHYDLFHYYGLDNKIDKALRRKVWLKSGGYLVFDHAEALTVIDVNTGKYVGTNGDLQQTILNTNIEAAQEVARQIRVRDISGIIVVDFIDMEDAANREKLLDVLRQATKRDRTRTSIMGITGLGIVEMTRKKLKQSLDSVFYEACPYCGGEGVLKSKSSMAMQARKECLKLFYETDCKAVVIKGHPAIIAEIVSMTKPEARLIPLVQNKMVYVLPSDNMHWEHLEVEPMESLEAAHATGATKLP